MNITEFFGGSVREDILGELRNTIKDYVPVFVFSLGQFPTTNITYYEWKNMSKPLTFNSRFLFRIPRNIIIVENDVYLNYPTDRKLMDVLANYPEVIYTREPKSLVSLMERDNRTKTAIEVFQDTSRVYVESDYYEEILLTFEYNVFETVREYFRILRGEDPSFMDYLERMVYMPKFCKLCGVFTGTIEEKSRDIFSIFNAKYRLKEFDGFVQYHSMIPRFNEISVCSLNMDDCEERYQNAVMITITKDTPPRFICADIYRDFKYTGFDDDVGISILSLYGYPFPMKHPPEEISTIVSNYEIYLQKLDIGNCEKLPLRFSHMLEIVRERIGEKKIIIYPFLKLENNSLNPHIRELGMKNKEKI